MLLATPHERSQSPCLSSWTQSRLTPRWSNQHPVGKHTNCPSACGMSLRREMHMLQPEHYETEHLMLQNRRWSTSASAAINKSKCLSAGINIYTYMYEWNLWAVQIKLTLKCARNRCPCQQGCYSIVMYHMAMHKDLIKCWGKSVYTTANAWFLIKCTFLCELNTGF